MAAQRILVVNDDVDAQSYLNDLFRCFGVKADWAYGWHLAVMRLENLRYDALLLDEWLVRSVIKSPFKWLREHGHEAPVIMMCEMTSTNHEEGVVHIIHKPVTPTRLKHVLNRAFQNPEQAKRVAEALDSEEMQAPSYEEVEERLKQVIG